MVYPTFDITSISERCGSDLAQFYKSYDIDPGSKEYSDVTNMSVYTDSAMTMQSMSSSIQEKIAKLLEISGESTIKTFDYAHDVVKKDEVTQKRMWIVRTIVFYQLLVYITRTFSNKGLYDSVYKDTSLYPFREDVVGELSNFKMGIFGSITPTSDIDIGFQYSGQTLQTPALAYMVSRFENAFLLFTGKNSLGFDIETYADMMTIPNPDKRDDSHPDYFYLDSSNFQKEHFQKVLVCAGTSVLRNAVLSVMDVAGHSLTSEEVTDVVDTFSIEKAVKVNTIFGDFYRDIKPDLSETWLKDAKSLVVDYMTSSYDEGRYKYYELVDVAERSKFKGTSHLSTMTPDEICEIMVNIGKALTYRMESYNCAPTVIHVVRILQAAKEKAEKYKTLTPKAYCVGNVQFLDPYCSLGKYGYALSCIEQLGYIYRFHNTYCVESVAQYAGAGANEMRTHMRGGRVIAAQQPKRNSSATYDLVSSSKGPLLAQASNQFASAAVLHYNKAKCDKKMSKYLGRFENGYFFFIQYYTGVISKGGRRRSRRPTTRRRRASRKRSVLHPTQKRPRRTKRARGSKKTRSGRRR